MSFKLVLVKVEEDDWKKFERFLITFAVSLCCNVSASDFVELGANLLVLRRMRKK